MSSTGLDAGQADTTPKQVPQRAVRIQVGHLPANPLLPRRRLWESHPAVTWAIRSHGLKTFVTEKICRCLLEQHFLGSCKINILGRMLLQVLHLQRGKEGMKLWSELAKMKSYSGVSFLCCKLENSEMCGTTVEAQTSK